MRRETMLATEALEEEHRVIERMVNVLQKACDKLEKGEEVSPEVFKKAVDFIRTFADRCHHGKEENILFPVFEERGIPREGGPIGIMLLEHEHGRRYVRGLADAIEKYERGDKSAKKEIWENARNYGNLLTQHIYKEENILYPMGNRTLSQSDQTDLMKRFEGVEKELGEDIHHSYVRLVEYLEKEVGR